jgi:4-amino-4-deoxy-L-arabinose transferase-like glycosyltransferase
VFLSRHLDRYLTEFQGYGGPPYYFLAVFFLGMLPWSVFLPFLFFRVAGRLRRTVTSAESGPLLLSLLWVVVIVAFFSLSQSKLPGYVLPAYPGAALLWGRFWHRRRTSGEFHRTLSRVLVISVGATAVVLSVLAWIGRTHYPLYYARYGLTVLALVGVFLTGFALSLWLVRSLVRPALVPPVLVLVSCTVTAIMVYMGLPQVERHVKTAPILARRLSSTLSPRQQVAEYPAWPDQAISFNCNFLYYLDHRVIALQSQTQVRTFLSAPQQVYCFMTAPTYRSLTPVLENTPHTVLDREGDNLILSNRPRGKRGDQPP